MKELTLPASIGAIVAIAVAAWEAFRADQPLLGMTLATVAGLTVVAMIGEKRKSLEEGFSFIRQSSQGFLRAIFSLPDLLLASPRGWERRGLALILVYLSLCASLVLFPIIYFGLLQLQSAPTASTMLTLDGLVLLFFVGMRTLGVSTRVLLGFA
jgi:hypothetical protein